MVRFKMLAGPHRFTHLPEPQQAGHCTAPKITLPSQSARSSSDCRRRYPVRFNHGDTAHSRTTASFSASTPRAPFSRGRSRAQGHRHPVVVFSHALAPHTMIVAVHHAATPAPRVPQAANIGATLCLSGRLTVTGFWRSIPRLQDIRTAYWPAWPIRSKRRLRAGVMVLRQKGCPAVDQGSKFFGTRSYLPMISGIRLRRSFTASGAVL